MTAATPAAEASSSNAALPRCRRRRLPHPAAGDEPRQDNPSDITICPHDA